MPNPFVYPSELTFEIQPSGIEKLYATQVQDSAMYRRAWILQGWLLAPRCLYFCQDQLFWTCGELVACESFPTGANYLSFEQTDSGLNDMQSMQILVNQRAIFPQYQYNELDEAWAAMIKSFTKSVLRDGRDKLSAISGVARRVPNSYATQYHAGLWRRTDEGFLGGLLWFMDSYASSTTHASPSVLLPAPALASSRYNRQMLIPSISLAGQQRLSNAKILIIGLGGLGSPAALYLAGSGIHTLGLLDDDQVELSNLHRQVVHRESSVAGKLGKVQSAIQGCKDLNSEVRYVRHEMRLSSETAMEVISAYDMVLDCTDNPATRYLISDACVVLEKMLVSGAAQRGEGQLVVLNYSIERDSAIEEEQDQRTDTSSREKGPCYRCVFPRPPSPEMVRGCSEIGILGPVVGTIGTLMACEAIKLTVNGGMFKRGVKPWMLLYNAFSTDPRNMFRSIGLRGRREDCVACGEDGVLASKGLQKITRKKLEERGRTMWPSVVLWKLYSCWEGRTDLTQRSS